MDISVSQNPNLNHHNVQTVLDAIDFGDLDAGRARLAVHEVAWRLELALTDEEVDCAVTRVLERLAR